MHSLKDMCYVELETETNSDHIGITFNKENLKVIFPRGYHISSDDKNLKEDILILIKVFDKYVKSKKAKSCSEDEKDLTTGKGNNFSMTNAIWLLNDYEVNGLYKEYIHRYKVDKKGNINWSKTIKSTTPYISGNDLIYLDFVVKEKNNDINNIILLTQKYIIEKCIDIIGWLYPSIRIEGPNKLPYTHSVCINLLKKELRLVNIDKTKRLLIHMIDFLENDGHEKDINSFKEYKTKYFMNIWEDMLNDVLGNDDPSKYYPKAIWEIDGKETDASKLRPDIILNTNKKTYVIDAKYYKYGITKSIDHLPQSSDINKQMLYSEYIKKNKGIESYDAFILPYKSNTKNSFKFVGNARLENGVYDKKKIVCILADTKDIMQRYIDGNKLEECKKDVIKIIDEQNKI